MNKLTKLTIKKFRNVAPTTLDFRPGINVLLGKNAAGKTTLLRLLSTVTGGSNTGTENDVMEVSCRIQGSTLDFERTLTRTRTREPLLPFETGQSEGISNLQQADAFVFEKNGTSIMSAQVLPNEVLLDLRGKQARQERRLRRAPFSSVVMALYELDEFALGDSVLAAYAWCEGRMDESLEQFQRLLNSEINREGPGSISSESSGLVPRSIDSALMEPPPEGTSWTFSPEFLARAAHILGYDSANARFDIERLSPEPARQAVRLSKLRFFFKRHGEEVSQDLLSYGQKRLLAFFAYADASRDVIIADELVNGLHHEWIEACLKEIGDRQAFLTSQNPLLLDFLRFDNVEEVRRTFILCERVSTDAGAQLIWRNPTEDEAESFFSAYQTGIQRVSDILLTKGLW